MWPECSWLTWTTTITLEGHNSTLRMAGLSSRANGPNGHRDGLWSQFQSPRHILIFLVIWQLNTNELTHTLLLYLADLIAKTMNRKHLDSSVVRATGVKSAAAKTLFPNIASVPGVPTCELIHQHVSRKTMAHAEI